MRSLKVGKCTQKMCVVIVERGETDSQVVPERSTSSSRRGRRGPLMFYCCGAFQSWHTDHHINEDLQLDGSGRVGPAAARRLTASSSRVHG